MRRQHKDKPLRNTKALDTEQQRAEPEADTLAGLERGAEPYWMQDVRIAQRNIAQKMAQIRASKAEGRSPSDD
jgi:hypothetical protein